MIGKLKDRIKKFVFFSSVQIYTQFNNCKIVKPVRSDFSIPSPAILIFYTIILFLSIINVSTTPSF